MHTTSFQAYRYVALSLLAALLGCSSEDGNSEATNTTAGTETANSTGSNQTATGSGVTTMGAVNSSAATDMTLNSNTAMGSTSTTSTTSTSADATGSGGTTTASATSTMGPGVSAGGGAMVDTTGAGGTAMGAGGSMMGAGGTMSAGADMWDNFAAGFFQTYCVSCHNEDGMGASSRDYTQISAVQAEASDIACGVVSAADWSARGCSGSPMAEQFPVGNGPSPTPDERARLVAWIDAGMP
jgi:hypothetical protein